VRTALPPVAWRMINRGTKPGKSQTKQLTFTCGEMEALAQLDEKLCRANGNSAQWRLSENKAYQQSMNKTMATTTFYGDEKVNPAGFTGFGAYYYSLTDADVDAVYREHIIDGGGTGNKLTSMWIVGWGNDTVHGIFEEGDTAGFKYRDNGRVPVIDANGGKFYAYESQYNWSMGIAVRDPRYIVRIANIDLSDTTATQKLLENMIKGYNLIEDPNNCKLAIYCNRQTMTLIDLLAQAKTNVNLTIDTFNGKKQTHFWGAPFRRSDAILTTESAID
ncbi:MAG: hypothetical protein RSC33_07440, partial [Vagococcus sp.]